MSDHPLIVITGATSGIGELAAIELARRGARLVLTARSRARAAATVAKIRAAAPAAEIELFAADFASLADVHRAGSEMREAHPRIDVLINNAGMHALQQRLTPEGLPQIVTVNYLAPWLLTRELLPSLLAGERSRVVTVASEASAGHGGIHLPADLTDARPFNALGSGRLYARSKLFEIMFSAELARRYRHQGLIANALCPGFNLTNIAREVPFFAQLQRLRGLSGLGDPARGAGIIVRLALAQRFGELTGGFFSARGRHLSPAKPGDDPNLQAELWQATAELLAKFV